MARRRSLDGIGLGLVLGAALAAFPAEARMQCQDGGTDTDGSILEVFEVESDGDLDQLLRSAAQRVVNYSQSLHNVSSGALSNFVASVGAPEAKTVTAGSVLLDSLAGFLGGQAEGLAKSGIEAFLPGGVGLPGIDFLLGFQKKLEAEFADMRQRNAQLALIDWVTQLQSFVGNSYGRVPAGKIEAALRSGMEEQVGLPGRRLGIDHLEWAGRLCNAMLAVERVQGALPSVEVVEGRLYETWINGHHKKGAMDSCVRLDWKFEEVDGKTYFYQAPGTVLGSFGPQLARRIDKLIPPVDDSKYPWSWITDVDAPICICLHDRPGATLKHPDCAIYDRGGSMERQPRMRDAFPWLKTAWDESEYIVPK